MEEKKKLNINWYDILSKIIFLIIIILILMWFFPRDSRNDDVNEKLDTIDSKLTILVDKIFRENLNEMKAAAKAYFTTDRVPTEQGDSIKLTLQEMYDKDMLLPLIDKDGNACDANSSYVEITKITDSEYSLKVSLTCGGETKSITETIGCYDFCEDNKCDNGTKLQYQFVREVKTTKYSCPSGYTLSGKYCYSSEFKQRVQAEKIWSNASTKVTDATKVTGGEKKVCKDATENQGQTSYSCPSGYTLNGTVCTKVEVIPASENYAYTCPEGYTKNNNYCYKTLSKNATKVYSYSCPSGYSKKNNKCYKTTTKSLTKTITGYSCPKGYSKKNGKCYKTTSKSLTKTLTGYSCPNGYTLKGTTCVKSEVVPATKVDGELSCPNGYYLQGSNCYKNITISATENPGQITYSCEEGWNLEGNKCCQMIKTDDEYYCSNPDATLDGDKCIIEIPAKVIGYKCPSGYKKDGKTCYKITTKKKRATSKTVISYQYRWSSFKSLYGWTRTGKTRSI